MWPRSVCSLLFLLTACLIVPAVAQTTQLKVFRGTLVHSRVRSEMEVLQDYLIGFNESNFGTIVFVRPATELGSLAQQWGFNQNDVVTLNNSQFLMPGLVDCHFHPSQYFRAGADIPSFLDFLLNTSVAGDLMFRNVTYAREESMRAVNHTLRFGTTTVSYFGPRSVDGAIELAHVVDELGQRAIVQRQTIDMLPFPVPNFIPQSTEDALRDSRRFIERIRELQNPLIRPSTGPDLAVTTSPELLRGLGAIVNETGVFVQTHFALPMPEINTTLPDWEAAGVLPVNRTLMTHSIYISESEMETYRRRGMSIAHCPNSNLNLNDGILDVRRMFNFGINVGLGTDIAGGYSPSVLNEMRTALHASRALRLNLTRDLPADYTALTLAEGFYMATMGGAEATGLGDTVGNFEVEKQFDALLVDTSAPVFDTTSSDTTNVRIEKFLYLGNDRNILKVFVAGRKIMLPSLDSPVETPTACNSAPPTSHLSLMMMGVVLLATAKLLM